jgi:hypothetical protein
VQQVLHPFWKSVFLWLDVNAFGYCKILHNLLHYGTNLVARIDGTTISGVAGFYITYPCCNKNTPHGQACDLKQARPGDSLDFQKKNLSTNPI